LRTRQRAARQPGAGAACDHRHVQAVAGAQHRGDLLLGLGQHDDERLLAVGGEPVALVRNRVLAAPQQRMRGQHDREFADHLRSAPRAFGHVGLRCFGRARQGGLLNRGCNVHGLSPGGRSAALP
jgi:hypothetical protein